jgi:pimeloyl-ACP methyl ester carboxylesterase
MLARSLQNNYATLQIDLRNHGLSAHSDEHNYEVLAQDVLETLDTLNVQNFSVIGHSMGGKVAMRLAGLAKARLNKLVVLDISPVASEDYHHSEIFDALIAVEKKNITTRQQATEIMQAYISEPMVIQFLLKSFNKGSWLFNVQSLMQNYPHILAWQTQHAWPKPALFLRGGYSDYISTSEHFSAIQQQFPLAKVSLIAEAGHWLHGEKPQQVIEEIQNYLSN